MDDWPALTLIKTSSRDSRVSCETLSHPEDHHKKDLFAEEKWHGRDDNDWIKAVGESEESAEEAFLSGMTCFPSRTAAHNSPKPMLSPGREGKKAVGDHTGGRVRTLPGPVPYSGPISYSGPIPYSGPISHSGHSGPIFPIISHSGTLKGYSTGGSKGHAGNAFTMMPPDVVGKKKPAGYESDEPTSPEVTCIGRVRIKKHCTTWDALLKEGNRGNRKGKKVSLESTREGKKSKWKQVLGVSCVSPLDAASDRHDIVLPQPHLPNLEIDLNRFSSASEVSSPITDLDEFQARAESGEVFAKPPLRSGDPEDSGYQPQVPPPNCLLLMRESRRQNNEQQVPPPD